MEILYGMSHGCMEIMRAHMEIMCGNSVWELCMEIVYGRLVWKLCGANRVWKLCVEILYGNVVWKY